ncbi:MAG: tetratricopeptide repeat protein, partial [Alphaproteobacteria bacterium]
MLAKAPGATPDLNNHAVTLRALGRRDEATRHLERARALNPDDPDINHNLGNALGDAGRDEDAILAYRRSLAARPGATRTSIQLAATLQRLRRQAEALGVTSDALAVAPAAA